MASSELYLQCNINRAYSHDNGYIPFSTYEYFKIDFVNINIEKYNALSQKYLNFCNISKEIDEKSDIKCEIDDEVFHYTDVRNGTGNDIHIYRASGTIIDEEFSHGVLFLGSYGTCAPGENVESTTRKF